MKKHGSKNLVYNKGLCLAHGPEFSIDQVAEVLLVLDHPFREVGLVVEYVVTAVFLHRKHDPVSTVIAHVHGDQALIETGKLSEVKLFQAPVYLQ